MVYHLFTESQEVEPSTAVHLDEGSVSKLSSMQNVAAGSDSDCAAGFP